MPDFVFPVIMLLIFIAILLAIYLANRHWEKKRREAVADLSSSLGLEFRESLIVEELGPLSTMELFTRGYDQTITNCVEGETEIAKIQIFDYRYTTGSGKHKSTTKQTVVVMTSPSIDVPAFSLIPEHFFSRIGNFFGMQDIDFDEHPQFSKMFQLKGPNEASIRAFFNSELMDFFCLLPDINTAAMPGGFIFFRPGKAIEPSTWKSLMDEGFRTYQALTAAAAKQKVR